MYAVNNLRKNLPYAALLDLHKAYDCVPRNTLQHILDQRLPLSLSTIFRPLLWPMRLQTKGQKTPRSIHTLSGMPQGDPPSPQLFHIFTDTLLRQVNINLTHGVASLFVDDVLLIARARYDMQEMVTSCETWAKKFQMKWAVEKSCGIMVPFPLKMDDSTLPNTSTATYLGVSLGPYGLTDQNLCERICSAKRKLHRLIRLTRNWRTTVRQRRTLVKTFIFILTDYMIYAQPMTAAALTEPNSLERRCLGYILNTPLSQTQIPRALAVAKLLPLRSRRRRCTAQLVPKFYSASIREQGTERDKINWNFISAYSTISPFVKRADLPSSAEGMGTWIRDELKRINDETWNPTAHFKRKIPDRPRLPPLYI